MSLLSVQIYLRWTLVMMEHFGNDFTTIFHLTDAAKSGKNMIHVLRENTYRFFLLVCWVYREDIECRWSGGMS